MDKDKLWELCHKFISDNNITCDETVYQADHVISNAYELVEGICDIVGYAEVED